VVQKLKIFVKSTNIADKHKETGQGRTKWKFFDKLNEFLFTKPAIHPPNVLDTLDNSTINNAEAESPAAVSNEEEVDYDGSNGEGHSNASDEAGDMIDNTQPSVSDIHHLQIRVHFIK